MMHGFDKDFCLHQSLLLLMKDIEVMLSHPALSHFCPSLGRKICPKSPFLNRLSISILQFLDKNGIAIRH